MLLSPAGQALSAFYILDVTGESQNYPTEIAVGDEAEVILKIVNNEQKSASYHIEIIVDGIKLTEAGPIILENNERWEDIIGFSAYKAGNDQKVEFLLFKDNQPEVYRSNHLWLDVK